MQNKKCTDCVWYVTIGLLHCRNQNCNFNHDGFIPREKTIAKPKEKSTDSKEKK